jgi:[protein-PII] uridylyltransferase
VAVDLETMEGAYKLTMVAQDRPALFASFAGAISSFGLNIVKAEAFSNSQGVILDTFTFTDPKRTFELNPPEAERLQDLMGRIALGKTDARRLFRNRPQPRPERRVIEPRIQFDSEAHETATLVEIVAEDRIGLLYSLATVFSSNACNIDTVLIDTKGHRAIDVFHIAKNGRKLSLEMQDTLKQQLLSACLGE